MADLKKAKKAEEVEVKVDVTPEVATDEKEVEVQVETEATVEVTEEPKVEVDTTPVDPKTQATAKNVRIRMRADHKCWLNNEVYELKKGQCYNVPESLKKRLNKAGLLLPL